MLATDLSGVQAYKHVFTSPSSIEKVPKATRSGNARIHGMTHVTLASIAYIATRWAQHYIQLHDKVELGVVAGTIHSEFLIRLL
jgi:hypothetical protein